MTKQYNIDNVFYKIIHKKIKCDFIYEDKDFVAINDIMPSAPIHILLMPKDNYVSFDDFIEKSSETKIAKFFKIAHQIARNKNLEKDGYRLVTNHGSNASQTVMHFHMHIIGGKRISGLSSEDKNKR